MAMLLSVNVGLPRDVTWNGQTVHTGIWKEPVSGPVMARRLNLDGDGQGDLGGHGGEQRAVMVYQAQSYEHWRQHLSRSDLGWGIFGENFTVDGLPDDQVCIGDRYRIGEGELEEAEGAPAGGRGGLGDDDVDRGAGQREQRSGVPAKASGISIPDGEWPIRTASMTTSAAAPRPRR